MRSPARRLAAATLSVAAAVAALTATNSGVAGAVPAAPLPADTSAFRGVNWADPRDNY
ncbi:MAG: hypothetical protein HOV67_07960, partial [Kribbellaceae bacterium]|nr:hypothetical protein [Kribbellaceae bacterium]